MDKWDNMVLVEHGSSFQPIEDYEVIETPINELSVKDKYMKEELMLRLKNLTMSQVLEMLGVNGWELVCISVSPRNILRQFFFKKKIS